MIVVETVFKKASERSERRWLTGKRYQDPRTRSPDEVKGLLKVNFNRPLEKLHMLIMELPRIKTREVEKNYSEPWNESLFNLTSLFWWIGWQYTSKYQRSSHLMCWQRPSQTYSDKMFSILAGSRELQVVCSSGRYRFIYLALPPGSLPRVRVGFPQGRTIW